MNVDSWSLLPNFSQQGHAGSKRMLLHYNSPALLKIFQFVTKGVVCHRLTRIVTVKRFFVGVHTCVSF